MYSCACTYMGIYTHQYPTEKKWAGQQTAEKGKQDKKKRTDPRTALHAPDMHGEKEAALAVYAINRTLPPSPPFLMCNTVLCLLSLSQSTWLPVSVSLSHSRLLPVSLSLSLCLSISLSLSVCLCCLSLSLSLSLSLPLPLWRSLLDSL